MLIRGNSYLPKTHISFLHLLNKHIVKCEYMNKFNRNKQMSNKEVFYLTESIYFLLKNKT